jgi:hypothetical protein
MFGKEGIAEILRSHYGSISLREYCESDDEIRFQLSTPIIDTQVGVLRSRATVLNELAISHRLSLLLGREKCGMPEDCAFAIRTVESVGRSIDVVDEYRISLRFDVMTGRYGAITALRSILVTKFGGEARITTMSFNVMSPSLANFVRRTRQFRDFAAAKIDRDESCLSTVADSHFRYYPSEDDRISDGTRVDHIPALTLIDIALSVNGMAPQETVYAGIWAEFMKYTDPRLALEVLLKRDHGAVEFVQNGQLVAIVRGTALPLG